MDGWGQIICMVPFLWSKVVTNTLLMPWPHLKIFHFQWRSMAQDLCYYYDDDEKVLVMTDFAIQTQSNNLRQVT